MTMLAIANESYPEPGYIKDGNSDYQVQKTVIWTSAMGDIEDVKEKLVDKMESNDFDPNDPDLRRVNLLEHSIITSFISYLPSINDFPFS